MDGIGIKTAPDGTRYVRPYLGRNPVTGKPIRPYLRLPEDASEDECKRIVQVWLMGRGEAAAMGSTTLVSDLMDRHLAYLSEEGRPENSMRAYRRYASYSGAISCMQAQDVSASDLSRLYAALVQDAGLSPATVIGCHRFLSGFFAHLVRLGIIQQSPADAAWVPRQSVHEADALMQGDVIRLAERLEGIVCGRVHATRAGRAEAMCAYIALNTGARVGEVCGLRRRDYMASCSSIRICGTVVEPVGSPARRQASTKGRKSRTVTLDEATDAVVASWAGGDGSSHAESGPLVPGPSGSWMRPSSASRAFGRLAKEMGLPAGTTFHTLRHTHATSLLMAGIDAKTVSERLGHADVSTTLRIYGHVMPGRDSEAAEAFRGQRTAEARRCAS